MRCGRGIRVKPRLNQTQLVNYLPYVRAIFVSKTQSGWKDVAMVHVASLIALIVSSASIR